MKQMYINEIHTNHMESTKLPQKLPKYNVIKITEEERQNTLLRIARHLILHGSFCPNAGLLKGKMGISIFFYELYRATNQIVYNDYAGDLIDEIYENMSFYTSLYFNDGLAGIGWGFEYLIRNKFVNADADDILENLDKQIIERDVRKITDISLDRRLKGLAHYVIARSANREKYAIETEYISNLIKSLQQQESKDKEIQIQTSILNEILQHKQIPENGLFVLKPVISSVQYEADNLIDEKRPLGILENGYAGIGLKLLNL